MLVSYWMVKLANQHFSITVPEKNSLSKQALLPNWLESIISNTLTTNIVNSEPLVTKTFNKDNNKMLGLHNFYRLNQLMTLHVLEY